MPARGASTPSSSAACRSTAAPTSTWSGSAAIPAAEKRFPGSYGSAYLYFVVPRVILFRVEHTLRTLVRKVDFVSAPGTSPAGVYRPGGPYALVTGRCVFRFEPAHGRFRLASLHPGHGLEEVRAATGFDFDCADDPPTTPAPDAETMALIHGPVGMALAEVYPRFAATLRGGVAE